MSLPRTLRLTGTHESIVRRWLILMKNALGPIARLANTIVSGKTK